MGLLWPTVSMTIAKGGEYNNDRGPNHIPRYHQGCDIAVGLNTAIYGSGSGTVTLVANTGTKYGYGLYVKVRYIVGNLTIDVINSHMNRVDVKVGNKVVASTLLGLSGGSAGSFGAGDATGPHDHLEIRVNGTLYDPRSYLANRSSAAGGGSIPIPPVPAKPELGEIDMPRVISVPNGSRALVSEFYGTVFGNPNDYSLNANALTYGNTDVPDENVLTTMVNEANGRGKKLVADIVAALPKATGGSGTAVDTTAILAAIADLDKQDDANQAQLLTAIAGVDEATLATFGLKRA